jgi:hypothetical protein
MKKVGIWIDRRRAVIVTIDGGKESRRVIEGDVERHAKPRGGWRMRLPWGPQAPIKEHTREQHYQNQVINFYKDVIKHIGTADHLLVMGPADAKKEFAQQVEKSPALKNVPITLEPADKMTDPQIAARVREFQVG